VHLAPSLAELDFHDPSKPLYEGTLGINFEKEWIKQAREVRRREMLDAPDRPNRFGNDAGASRSRPLDLIDWESQIVFNSE
jgi:hypothetical protein